MSDDPFIKNLFSFFPFLTEDTTLFIPPFNNCQLNVYSRKKNIFQKKFLKKQNIFLTIEIVTLSLWGLFKARLKENLFRSDGGGGATKNSMNIMYFHEMENLCLLK